MRRRLLLNQDEKHLVFNQLIRNGNFVDTSNWGTNSPSLIVEAINNIITITSTQTYSAIHFRQSFTPTLNHKYMISFYARNVKPLRFGLFEYNSQRNSLTCDENSVMTKVTGIITSTYETSNYFSFRMSNVVSNDYMSFKEVMLIDLTAMYGEGNEPTSTSVVEQDCASIGHPLTQWQPYTPIS